MGHRLITSFILLFSVLSLAAQISSYPYSQSWENQSKGNWINGSGGNLSWVVNSGATPTVATGPDSASDGTYYLHVESSGAKQGQVAILENRFDLTSLTNPELVFDYHAFYGLSRFGGSLKVKVSSDRGKTWSTVWHSAVNKGKSWQRNQALPLNGYGYDTLDVQFHFTVGANTPDENDVAIDNIRVRNNPNANSCHKPLAIKVQRLSTDTALVTWKGSAPSYRVFYGPAGLSYSRFLTSKVVSKDSAQLTNLRGGMNYELIVTSLCSNFTRKSSSPVYFSSSCSQVTPGYRQLFEIPTSSGRSNCWQAYSNDTSQSVQIEYSDGHIGPGHLVMRNRTANSGDTLMAYSPRLQGLKGGDAYVQFWAKAALPVGQSDLILGTVQSPGKPSTFQVMDTIEIRGDTSYHFAVLHFDSASSYNFSHEYLAMMHSNSSSGDNLYIDNFKYDTTGNCTVPENFKLLSVSSNSVSVDVGPGNGMYVFNWGPKGFAQGSPTSFFRNDTAPISITGLNPGKRYDLYISQQCSLSSASWIGPISFRMGGNVINTPATIAFDLLSNFRNSWINQFITSRKRWSQGYGANGGTIGAPFKGSGNIVFPGSGGGSNRALTSTKPQEQKVHTNGVSFKNGEKTRLLSPAMEISNLRYPVLSFYYAQESKAGRQNRLRIFVKNASGTNWTQIFEDTTNVNTWTQKRIKLPPGLGDTIQFALEGEDRGGYANVIDELVLRDSNTCPGLDTLYAMKLGSTEGTVYWKRFAAQSSVEISYGKNLRNPGKGIKRSVSVVDSLNVMGLQPGASYCFFAREVCAAGDTSNWRGPVCFSTPCGPQNLAMQSKGCDRITLQWNSSSGGSLLKFGPKGAATADSVTNVVQSPLTITGLSPGASYEFRVADTCAGDTSAFTAPLVLSTDTTPLPVAKFAIDSACVFSADSSQKIPHYYVDASNS